MSEELLLSRKTLKWGFGLLALIGLVLLGLSSLPAPFIFSVEAPFVTAPDSDDELREWLIAQLGVAEESLGIQRTKDNRIKLFMIVSRSPWMRPRFPDVDSKCLELGYKLSGPFQHITRNVAPTKQIAAQDKTRVVTVDDWEVIKKIALNDMNGPANLDGWRVVESRNLHCRVAWPKKHELNNLSIYSGKIGMPTFTIEAYLRTPEWDVEVLSAGFEKDLERVLVCEEIEAGDGVRCKVVAGEVGGGIAQIIRVYVSEKFHWTISASVCAENIATAQHTLAYFFSNFEVTPEDE